MNIRSIYLLIICHVPLIPTSQALVESDEQSTKALQDWEETIRLINPVYGKQALDTLAEAVVKLSRPNGAYTEWRQSLFQSAQNKLLSISGHAQYFADKIRLEQEAVSHLGPSVGERSIYDRDRSRIIDGILVHLPSPETIRVLGEFLSDEKDYPPSPFPSDFRANCDMACKTLTKIGLRDSPQIKPYQQLPGDLKLWRDWYGKVKSGQLAFSFIGQNVEYRFKPDGTVESPPLASKPTERNTSRPPIKPQQPAENATNQTEQGKTFFLRGSSESCSSSYQHIYGSSNIAVVPLEMNRLDFRRGQFLSETHTEGLLNGTVGTNALNQRVESVLEDGTKFSLFLP